MSRELLTELYFRELEAKNDQDQRLGVLVGLLAIVAGVLIYGFEHSHLESRGRLIAFIGLFGFASVFYFAALVQVLRANIGHTYERLPMSQDIYDFSQGLHAYYLATSSDAAKEEQAFKDFLDRRMSSAATRNAQSNLSRAARNYSAMCLLACAAVSGILAGAVALVASPQLDTNGVRINQVEIHEPASPATREQAMSTNEERPKDSEPQAPNPIAPAKPAEPKNVLFRGGQDPPKRPSDAAKSAENPTKKER